MSAYLFIEMYDYIVSNLRLRIEGPIADNFDDRLQGFKPFAVERDAQAVCDMVVKSGCSLSLDGVECQELTRFDFAERDAECVFLRSEEDYILTIKNATRAQHIFKCNRNSTQCVQTNAGVVDADYSFLRFGIWFMLNIAAVQKLTAAVHTSVIVCHDEAIMFLGESGTGKSTHTRLWRENIEGATLLNDDSPFVGIRDGRAMAYGSPWSGKTPCYKNESYPIRAIVRLSQAPHNKMYRLGKLQAIGALLPSLPPAFAFDDKLEDAVMNVLSAVVSKVPVYHLECLPNAEAAQLSHDTIFGV